MPPTTQMSSKSGSGNDKDSDVENARGELE